MTFTELQSLAMLARPTDDDDWGTERQIDAENSFFKALDDHFPAVQSDEFQSWCLKATTEEMIDEALANAANIYGAY